METNPCPRVSGRGAHREGRAPTVAAFPRGATAGGGGEDAPVVPVEHDGATRPYSLRGPPPIRSHCVRPSHVRPYAAAGRMRSPGVGMMQDVEQRHEREYGFPDRGRALPRCGIGSCGWTRSGRPDTDVLAAGIDVRVVDVNVSVGGDSVTALESPLLTLTVTAAVGTTPNATV